MKNYYKEGTLTDTNVGYSTWDSKGNLIRRVSSTACFSEFSIGCIKQEIKKIIFFRPISQIPYSLQTIQKWIKLINEFGFPCHFSIDKAEKKYNFTFILKEYKYRPQVLSALSLARCLSERGICKVPNLFFQALDANPKVNKFSVLQKCHKNVGDYGYCNTNHMVTYRGNGRNISLKKLFKNFEESDAAEIYSLGRCGIDHYWAR